ncbi:ABC transporter ATP-binding protein [Roseovarius indicus]|uniref:ABC transporter ATP-binding protein n=1 Tax=Roseovarius indicus TaxID=540747 RepID=UPI0032EB6A87
MTDTLTDTATPILSTTNIGKQFGGVKALEGIDFALAEGELRCLIGPNGAGKSTFFRCLTKQYQPTTGKVFFRGRNVSRLKTHEIARLGIGIKTQVPNVFDGLTVRENLHLAASARMSGHEASTACDEAIERMSLQRIVHERLDRLSHGQRQWVELAMIITSRPYLILLDEPTAGMTSEEVAKTVELIHEINRDTALVIVEHDMNFVRAIARKVTVFHQGRIFAEEFADEIMRDPKVGEIYLGKRNTVQ